MATKQPSDDVSIGKSQTKRDILIDLCTTRRKHVFSSITYLLLSGGVCPRSRIAELSAPSPVPSLGSTAHADRGIRTPTSRLFRLSTASSHAAAQPAEGRLLATGSRRAIGRSIDVQIERSGTASGSSPRKTSGTPSATAIASQPRASSRAEAIPVSSGRSKLSSSKPARPSPCTPSC